MASKIRIFGIVALLIASNVAFGQTDEEKALTKGREAITLMDNGKIDESIKLLKEAIKLDPDRFDYPYEMAIAHYMNKNYKSAIKILEKNKKHKNVEDRLFQLLGNAYDLNGQTDKAFEAYDEGLELFPNSGMIHLEKGNIYYAKKDYNKAINLYETGIELDPAFPSNYYRAALLYLSSTEEVWGMLYGEIFMNLERGTARTAEISKLLYDTYKSEIKFTSDTEMSVSFCQSGTININDLTDTNNFKLPFGMMVYEPLIMMNMFQASEVYMTSLDEMRTAFTLSFYENGHAETYPNALFDYQKKVIDAGHFEAYNHWILMKGDEDAFDDWFAENETKWKDFITWFTDNGMVLDQDHKFYRGQY